MDNRIFATNLKNLTRYAERNFGNRVAFSYRKGKKEIAEKTYTEFQNDINGLGTYLYKNDSCNEKIAIIGVYGPDYEEIVKKIKQDLSSIKFLTNMGSLEEYINEGNEEIEKGYLEFVDKEIKDDSEAMIIYTSGSTGKPKGVMVANNNVMNLAYDNIMNITENDIFLQLIKYTFDVSVMGYLVSLIKGATTIIADDKVILDPCLTAYILSLPKEDSEEFWK